MRKRIPIICIALVISIYLKAELVRAQPATNPTPSTDDDLQASAMKGSRLSDAEAAALEDQLKADDSDAGAHAELLQYYLTKQFSSPSARDARRPHALWMIRNRPADPFTGSPICQFQQIIDPAGYAAASDLWKQQVTALPKNPAVLGNAAAFLAMNDPDGAIPLLHQAEELDPKNPRWPEQLGEIDKMRAIMNPAGKTTLAADELKQLEQALQLTTNPAERFYRLSDLPKAALDAGDAGAAKEYATQLLAEANKFPHDWNFGNAIYTGHTVLGRVALGAGDVATAKAELLLAGKTKGSPQLNSFGPNMVLARDLLAKGENDTVLQFFDLCRTFWAMGLPKLQEWSDAVKQGRAPDFGSNLVY